MKPRTFLKSLTFLAMTPGCGSFAEDPGKPTTLAAVQGKLNNATSADLPANVGVALTWMVNGDDGKVAVDLPLTPKFPLRYEIEILDPPPPEAIQRKFESEDPFYNTHSGVAWSYVVAYADGNHNGHLDLASSTDKTASDSMVATNRKDVIAYIEASDADLAAANEKWRAQGKYRGGTLKQGFNLMFVSKETDEMRVLDQTSPFVVDLEVDEDFGQPVCAEWPTQYQDSSRSIAETGRPEHYPQPDDLDLYCLPNGAEYSYDVCVTHSTGACTSTVDCETQEWFRPDPIPADWPCPDSSTQTAQ